MYDLARIAVVFSCIAVLTLTSAEDGPENVDKSLLEQKYLGKIPQKGSFTGEVKAPSPEEGHKPKDVVFKEKNNGPEHDSEASRKKQKDKSLDNDQHVKAPRPEEDHKAKDVVFKEKKDEVEGDSAVPRQKQKDESLDNHQHALPRDDKADGTSELRVPIDSGRRHPLTEKKIVKYEDRNWDDSKYEPEGDKSAPGKRGAYPAYKKHATKDLAHAYTLKFTMLNYGSESSKVYAQTLVPDGVEIKSYSLTEEASRKRRDTDDAEEDDQLASARVAISPGQRFLSEMSYVNHPESIIDPNTKVFHKADVKIEVAEGGLVGGKIYTPDYPGNYPNGAQLSWTFSYANGNVVRLQVDSYSTEACCDSLTVYDGSSKASPILGAVSGNGTSSQNTTYTTTGPTMFVLFTSDCLVSSSGIEASYINVGSESPATTASTSSCGPVLVTDANSGDVVSPNYPGNYYNNMDCTWQVQTYYGTVVRFTFNYFITERGYDRLYIYDGTVQNPGNLLLSASGFDYTGYQVWASSNRAFLVFTSDGSVTASGFNISYVGAYRQQTTTEATTRTATKSCGSVESNGNNGIVVSPNFPSNYDNNMDCTWEVQTYYGTRVLFTVNYFNTEGCCDRIYFYDGTVQNPGSLLATLSGQGYNGYQVLASSYRAFMTFTSDSSVTASGFNISYTGMYQQQTTVPPTQNASCGTTYLYYSGDFASPGYYTDGHYSNNLDCYWKISVSYGYVVRFTVEYFSVEYYYDWLNIYNGYTTNNASLITRLTGYITPYTQVATTSSRYATAWFHSDYIVDDVGFVMDFSWVNPTADATTGAPEVTTVVNATCSDVTYLAGSWGDIESPNYPNYYYSGLNCEWSVQTPYGTYVQFTVLTFSLSSGDSLTIYNGNHVSNNTIVDIWYYYLPYGHSISVSSNQAFLVFRSDYVYESYGFHLRYSYLTQFDITTNAPSATDASPTECGGEVLGDSGFISSPFYPNYYIDDLDCVWSVHISFGQYVLFTIQAFHLEYYADYVCIFEGTPSEGGSQIAYLTGIHSQGEQYLATNSSAYVTFHSDYSITYSGFNITFEAVPENYIPVSPTSRPSDEHTTMAMYPTWWYERKVEEGVMTFGIDLWKGAKNRPRKEKDTNHP